MLNLVSEVAEEALELGMLAGNPTVGAVGGGRGSAGLARPCPTLLPLRIWSPKCSRRRSSAGPFSLPDEKVQEFDWSLPPAQGVRDEKAGLRSISARGAMALPSRSPPLRPGGEGAKLCLMRCYLTSALEPGLAANGAGKVQDRRSLLANSQLVCMIQLVEVGP